MSRLIACPSCSRHVRASEDACPFCKAVLTDALRNSRAPLRPPLGLSRSALYALGVSALAFATACSSDPEPMLVAAYGAFVPGCVFPGPEVVGVSCTGDFYIESIVGECPERAYLVCRDGAWAFTTTIPTGYGPVPDGGATTADSGAVRDGAIDATTDGSDAHADGSSDATTTD